MITFENYQIKFQSNVLSYLFCFTATIVEDFYLGLRVKPNCKTNAFQCIYWEDNPKVSVMNLDEVTWNDDISEKDCFITWKSGKIKPLLCDSYVKVVCQFDCDTGWLHIVVFLLKEIL